MIEPFVYDPLPTRVIFGSGTLARLGPEVERTAADPYWNPRPLERAAIRDLLTRAWSGEPPRSA